MNLEFIRKVDNGTLWRMADKKLSPYELSGVISNDNRKPSRSSYILIAPNHLGHSPILTFNISDEFGTKGAYRGFALTRDLDRAKQEFEQQLGHRGAIEANSKGL